MDRLSLLRHLSFGAQVAEDETQDLANYFVETDQWLRIFNGEVDVIRGPKGAGKSAIYSLLAAKTSELFDKAILLVTAERPRGTPVFKELVLEPPTSELAFIGLWKLYIAVLLAQKMREFEVKGPAAEDLYRRLTDQGLLDEDKADLARTFRAVMDYARRWLNPAAVEIELKLEPQSGLPAGVSGRITGAEPSSELRSKGYGSVDELLKLANVALDSVKYKV